jgi:transposase
VRGSDYTLEEFLREHPDSDRCLDWLWRERFAPDGAHALCPRCRRERRFHRTRTRAAYTCDSCGLHVHPMKGTIFENTRVPLERWFYAIYLMGATGGAISISQLQRELGVTQRTARRIDMAIRTELMHHGIPEGPAGLAQPS